jgi:hypothetical protein
VDTKPSREYDFLSAALGLSIDCSKDKASSARLFDGLPVQVVLSRFLNGGRVVAHNSIGANVVPHNGRLLCLELHSFSFSALKLIEASRYIKTSIRHT